MKYIMTIVMLVVISCTLMAKDVTRLKKAISFADFNNNYAVKGPLGVELGKVVLLEVEKVKEDTKENPPTLKILSVNGNKLKKPVYLNYHMLLVQDVFEFNRVYRVKAYQDGAFSGTPDEVLKDVMFQTKNYYFEVTLVVYRILQQ